MAEKRRANWLIVAASVAVSAGGVAADMGYEDMVLRVTIWVVIALWVLGPVCMLIWPPDRQKGSDKTPEEDETARSTEPKRQDPYPWYVASAARHTLVLATDKEDARTQGEADLAAPAIEVRPATDQEISDQPWEPDTKTS